MATRPIAAAALCLARNMFRPVPWSRAKAALAEKNAVIEKVHGEEPLDLDAQLDCYMALGDELRFVLITSAARLAPLAEAPDSAADTDLAGLRLLVTVSSDEKCERCWHRRPEVGHIAAHPSLCERCVENIDGDGEVQFSDFVILSNNFGQQVEPGTNGDLCRR